MKKANFIIEQMDCPSEEQMIRMALQANQGISSLDFDIPNRSLNVVFTGELEPIESKLAELRLGSRLNSVTDVAETAVDEVRPSPKRTLYLVLGINFAFFVIESIFGFAVGSMGLVADALDMLADSFVYALSLYALNHSVTGQKRVAAVSGYFQFILAGFGFVEVIRRFANETSIPDPLIMAGVSAFALLANLISLRLLMANKDQGAHMKASWIFTSNDVLANIGVILAAGLVFITQSKLPDLAVGSIIFLIVVIGAFRILKLSR